MRNSVMAIVLAGMCTAASWGEVLPRRCFCDLEVRDVGSRKQLFIDRRFILDSHEVELRMNPPRKMGTLIPHDKPWEGKGLWVSSVAEADGKFHMWYGAHPPEGPAVVCYATSDDGLHWEKPSLGVFEYEGSTDNNIVQPANESGVVFYDPQGSSEERFKAVGVRYFSEEGGLFIHTSPDGINWTVSDDNIFPFYCDSANQAFWDPRIERYVAYMRVWDHQGADNLVGRKIGRIETDDITRPWPYEPRERPFYLWGESVAPAASTEVPLALSYDHDDPPKLDHYNPAFALYPWAEDVYLMFPSAFQQFPHSREWDNNGLHAIQLAVSRDGVTYHRPHRGPYINISPAGEQAANSLYASANLLRRGDKIIHYYTAYEWRGQRDGKSAPPEIYHAVQRLDGFVSADFAYTGGELLTPWIRFEGGRLVLNMDASAAGSLQVGLRDEKGRELPGFSVDDCDPIMGNFIRRTVTWNGNDDLSSLAGRPVQLYFRARGTKLFAFQFE